MLNPEVQTKAHAELDQIYEKKQIASVMDRNR